MASPAGPGAAPPAGGSPAAAAWGEGDGWGAGGVSPAKAPLVQATLESGKHLRAQTLLYSVGRQGTTGDLRLDKAGLHGDVETLQLVDKGRPAQIQKPRRLTLVPARLFQTSQDQIALEL